MADDTLQEVRERLIKIEVLLENMNKNSELKNEILEEKIKVANNRISDLENSGMIVLGGVLSIDYALISF